MSLPIALNTIPPAVARGTRHPSNAARRLLTAELAEQTGITSGVWIYALDRKGRLVVPPELARQWGPRVVLAAATVRGQHRLLLWPPLLWAKRECERGHRLGWWETEGSLAAECVADPSTGRIVIPHLLREMFGLRSGEEQVIRRLAEVAEVLPASEWRRQMRGTR